MNAIIAEYIVRGCPPIFPPDIVRLDDVNVMVEPAGCAMLISMLRMVWMAGDEESIRYIIPRFSLNIADHERQHLGISTLDSDPAGLILGIIVSELPSDIVSMAIDKAPASRLSRLFAGRALPVASIIGPDMALKVTNKICDLEGQLDVETRYSIDEDTI